LTAVFRDGEHGLFSDWAITARRRTARRAGHRRTLKPQEVAMVSERLSKATVENETRCAPEPGIAGRRVVIQIGSVQLDGSLAEKCAG